MLDPNSRIPLHQSFLEEFKKRNSATNPFYYGFGRRQPLNPFLFKIPPSPKIELFNSMWFYSPDSSAGPVEFTSKFNVKGDRLIPFNKLSFVSIISCAVEVFTSKISPIQSRCTLCNLCDDHNKILDHIIENHSNEITKYLEPHMPYINDDTEYMAGMLTKLQFDSEITIPENSPTKKQQFGLGFTAPVIDIVGSDDESYELYDEDEDEDDDNPPFPPTPPPPPPSIPSPYLPQSLSSNSSIPMTNNGLTLTGQHKCIRAATESYSPDFKTVTFKDSANAPISYFLQKYPQNLPFLSLFELDPSAKMDQMPPPATLFMPFLDFYLKGPQTVKPNNLIEFDNYEFEADTEKEKMNKRKSKQPEFISYIQTIPEEIRNTVISNITQTFVRNYVSGQLCQTIRPILQTKKKQLQKKLRDEKLIRARNEGRQRLQAMRERRKARIEALSNSATEPMIRSFIKNEIEKIFEEESRIATKILLDSSLPSSSVASATTGSSMITAADDSKASTIPVVVAGLAFRRHLSPQFLIDTFGNLNFVLDENCQPKVRFRLNGNRIEGLLYLSSKADVSKALSLSPLFVENCSLSLSLEEEHTNKFTLFTQQEVNFISSIKNIDKVMSDGGKSNIDGMMPFYLPCDDHQQQTNFNCD